MTIDNMIAKGRGNNGSRPCFEREIIMAGTIEKPCIDCRFDNIDEYINAPNNPCFECKQASRWEEKTKAARKARKAARG
jgi:hypothetical protein